MYTGYRYLRRHLQEETKCASHVADIIFIRLLRIFAPDTRCALSRLRPKSNWNYIYTNVFGTARILGFCSLIAVAQHPNTQFRQIDSGLSRNASTLMQLCSSRGDVFHKRRYTVGQKGPILHHSSLFLTFFYFWIASQCSYNCVLTSPLLKSTKGNREVGSGNTEKYMVGRE